MMPTIRIDQEIYDYLNEKGKTADTFSDVLRRELGLDQKPTKGQIMRHLITGLADDQRSHSVEAIRGATDRHLPPHWASTPAREAQIIRVVKEFVRMPRNLSVEDREIAARKRVAEFLGIDPNTVFDKYGRQLYGDGGGQAAKFRTALRKIESDLQQ